ncbi:MAG: glutathione S-transferase family protein [Oceanococcus sp.]
MLQIYGDVYSGNCYKVLLCCRILHIPFQWTRIDILQGQSRSADFLQLNPNGRIPLLRREDDSTLAESNAILNYLAADSALLPSEPWQRAQILQWQFFEQYSHEPAIAVARYIQRYLGSPEHEKQRHASCLPKGYQALDVMEQQLRQHPYIAGSSLSIADISLYAYTHVANEGGFSLERYPHIQAWLGRIAEQPGIISMDEAAHQYESVAQ